jgi:hypothetical protein
MTSESPPLNMLERHPDIAFLQGSALKIEDLMRLSIGNAAEIVLLAGDNPRQDPTHLQDHRCIVVANTIELMLKELNSPALAMFELHYGGSARFLCPLKVQSRRPSCLKSSSETKTDLLRQGSNGTANSEMSSSKSLSSWKVGEGHFEDSLRLERRFACGQVLTLNFVGEMLGREYYVPSAMQVLETMIMPVRKGQESMPFLVPIPKDLVGQTWGQLFVRWISDRDIAPAVSLGIYRSLEYDRDGAEACHVGYVIAQPPPSHLLRKHDLVYVLTTSERAKTLMQESPSLALNEQGLPEWRDQLEQVPGEEVPQAPAMSESVVASSLRGEWAHDSQLRVQQVMDEVMKTRSHMHQMERRVQVRFNDLCDQVSEMKTLFKLSPLGIMHESI